MDLQKRIFIQLIDDYKGIIRSLCKSYYPSIEDQHDAFQDIALQLWKARDSFRGDSSISTWIYKVSINTLLSKKRKEKRSVATDPIEKTDQFVSKPFADDDLELLQLIIQSLRNVDKAIVILYLEGYQNKEIAFMLKLSASNVGTRLNRVKSSLKRKFKKSLV